MLVKTFNPFQNLAISSLVAAIPILLFLICLTVLKMKGMHAALVNLAVTFFIALIIFKLPFGEAAGSVIQGNVCGKGKVKSKYNFNNINLDWLQPFKVFYVVDTEQIP
jgi:hypothetical protein